MSTEYKLQLHEAFERIEFLESQNKKLMDELEITKKELKAKNEIVEDFEMRKRILQSLYDMSQSGELWNR